MDVHIGVPATIQRRRRTGGRYIKFGPKSIVKSRSKGVLELPSCVFRSQEGDIDKYSHCFASTSCLYFVSLRIPWKHQNMRFILIQQILTWECKCVYWGGRKTQCSKSRKNAHKYESSITQCIKILGTQHEGRPMQILRSVHERDGKRDVILWVPVKEYWNHTKTCKYLVVSVEMRTLSCVSCEGTLKSCRSNIQNHKQKNVTVENENRK